MMNRIRGLLAAAMVATVRWMPLGVGVAAAADDPIVRAAQAAEHKLKARLGLAVHDTGDGRSWLYRADERFPLVSTAKVLICGALLHQGPASMDTTVRIRQGDILSYAPTTKDLVEQEVSASELCAITLRNSDNTAANGALRVVGGPGAVTSFLRTIGDRATRLDRDEPSLNEGKPGDPRDTTTPQAMARTMQALVLGNALDTASRKQLAGWLIRNEVGGPLLRAGVPGDWQVADRTGSGGFGTRAIVAVVWPPKRAPIVAAIYLTETEASIDERNAAIASIGQAIAASLRR